MRAWLPNGLRGRLVPPVRGVFGAALLALAVLCPTVGKAHFGWQLGGQQIATVDGCVALPMGRAIRAPFPCQISVKTSEPERREDSRKLAASLLAELYCRTQSEEVSEITRKTLTGLLAWSSLQRVINTGRDDPVAMPEGRFETPLDLGMAGRVTLAPPPDG